MRVGPIRRGPYNSKTPTEDVLFTTAPFEGEVDASLIDAPSSTKSREGKRDAEMCQTRKGKQWYFGMKAHIGVDESSGLAHNMETAPANVSGTNGPRSYW